MELKFESKEAQKIHENLSMILEVLSEIEWLYYNDQNYKEDFACPICSRNKEEGHADSCKLDKSIKLLKVERK